MTKSITIHVSINASLETIWETWTKPNHISNWAVATDDWEAIAETNDLRKGGTFKTRMQDKNTKEGFDFEGRYDVVKQYELIEYTMSDKRHVKVEFEKTPDGVTVTEKFDPESENSIELQRSGWQTMLDNFKKYTEKEK